MLPGRCRFLLMIKGVSAQNPHRPRFSADLTRSWAKLRRAAAVLRSEANFRETKRKMRFRLAVSLKLRSSHENRRGAANRDSGRSPTKNIRQITETAGRQHPARPEPYLGRVPGGDDPAPKLAFGFPLGKSSGWRTFGSARRTMAKVERIEGFSITARQNRGTRRLLPVTPEHPLTLPVLHRDFAKPNRPPTKPPTPLNTPNPSRFAPGFRKTEPTTDQTPNTPNTPNPSRFRRGFHTTPFSDHRFHRFSTTPNHSRFRRGCATSSRSPALQPRLRKRALF